MNAMEWMQTLLISGLCVPSFCADYRRQHCLIETPKSWSDAQSYCRERGHDLATVDDMGAMKSLLGLSADRADDELWIGLHHGGPEEWHWSLADEEFYREGERDYRNFGAMDDTSRYVSHVHGKWKTVDHTHLWFVCYDGNRQGGGRYVFVKEVRSWTGAQQYCRSHHTDLVSIRNPEENQAVRDVIGPYDLMIGLFKDAWHWSDGRNSSFRHWEQDSFVGLFPQSCAAMTGKGPGRWSQRSCDELRPFLCTCTRRWVVKVKVRSEDIQELNDPATLKQTQKLLNEAALSNHHKVAWRTNSDGQVFTKEQCLEEEREQPQDLCNIE
ncbi:unnamed protein product [Boreogadus saida]